MPVLSLCMIVKNEEKYLRDCLESVKSVADEIIIVDTGSTDSTTEIAKEFNANILYYEWNNNFSDARNFALKNCTGNWILYLDADERISEKSIDELRRNLGKYEKLGVKCTVKSIDSYNNRDNSMKYTRLFRNLPDIAFTGRVHEQIELSLIKQYYKIVNSNIEIIHLGYNVSHENKKEKARRNLELLLLDYAETNSCYIAFQLAQTYNILEDEENAEKYSIMAIDGKNLSPQHRAISYALLSNNEFKRHQSDSALHYIKEGLRADNRQPYLNLLASKIYYRLQDNLNAEEFCRKAFEANSRLLSGNNYSALDIILNDEEIIYYGISLAKSSRNQRYFNLYLNAIKKYFERCEFTNADNKIAVLRKIYADETIKNGEVEEIISVINKNNLNNILEILKLYKSYDSKLKILSKIAGEYLTEPAFAGMFGITLADNNLMDEAKKVLESVVNSQKAEPAALFYLISIYARENNFNKISVYIKSLEEDFSHIPEVKLRLPLLKQKLTTLGQM
jgi:glycosyltransferase involved in cell wall biosynthesis